jgi:hypothetical protein
VATLAAAAAAADDDDDDDGGQRAFRSNLSVCDIRDTCLCGAAGSAAAVQALFLSTCQGAIIVLYLFRLLWECSSCTSCIAGLKS